MKYRSTDKRTGYNEGEIVELTEQELIDTPYNVKMVLSDVPQTADQGTKKKSKGKTPKKKKSSEKGKEKHPGKQGFDLDGDGDFDEDDLSIAGKTLANAKKAKKGE